MSAYPAYNYDSAARQLNHYDRYDFEVVPGRSQIAQNENQALSFVVSTVVRVLAVVVLMFMVVGIARVTLSSATIATALEANQITSAIEDARIQGSALEVEQSLLSNPARIRGEAGKLSMAVPSDISYIILPEDVVVKDAVGNLSLSGSVAAASGM